MSIKWRLPTTDEPGFLRRRRDLAELLDLLPTPENTEKLMDFLVPYVEGDDPKEQLLNATQAEYSLAVVQMLGYGNTVSDPKGVSSVPQ